MDKGTRVRITKGRDEGKAGVVFWVGEDRYGPGKRFGLRGDDGTTYWAREADVEVDDGPAPELPTADRTYGKGDRVAYEVDGERAYGSVFWTGESRAGGQRLGLKAEADGETVWRDARFVEPADDGAPAARTHERADDDGVDAIPAEYSSNLGMDELPPAADYDDAAIDALMSGFDDDPPSEG